MILKPKQDRGGRGWIRTTEVDDGRFTVCSLWPLGVLKIPAPPGRVIPRRNSPHRLTVQEKF